MRKILFVIGLGLTLGSCQQKSDVTKLKVQTPQVLESRFFKEAYKTEQTTVKSGQGLFQAMQNISIQNAKALELINALRDKVEFTKIKVGDTLKATRNLKGELVSFSFSQNAAEKHVVNFNNENMSWDYSFKEEVTHWHSRIVEGQLRGGSTLQDDLLARGLSRSVTAEVINVLLCKINFRTHARAGDRYKIFLKERMFDQQVIETEVVYTSYRGRKAKFVETYYYNDGESGSTYNAHYTKDGLALIRSGLRYPLSRLHIRSGFGPRIHPVTGKRRMHRGIDLRAPSGTSVHAVARGLVVNSSYNKYAGNKIAIRHSDGSTSYYLHLRNRAVKKGDRVISNQVIGRAGSTGRVTGAHLHFGFRASNGRWIDPMMKRMIATPKLEGERYERLQQQVADIKGAIQDLEISKVTRYLLSQIPNEEIYSQDREIQKILKDTLDTEI